jgi:hypothetical protein
VDEFENGLRIVAKEIGRQVHVVEYRLTLSCRVVTLLDEYVTVAD